jgi:hypothetical protein
MASIGPHATGHVVCKTHDGNTIDAPLCHARGGVHASPAQVHFAAMPQPPAESAGNGPAVVSASIDGLIAVHDTNQPLTSDDAFLAAANLETSVEQVTCVQPIGVVGAEAGMLPWACCSGQAAAADT